MVVVIVLVMANICSVLARSTRQLYLQQLLRLGMNHTVQVHIANI